MKLDRHPFIVSENRECAHLKTRLNAHWQEGVAKCADARAKPDADRMYPSPTRLCLLDPLAPE
jgi:hypothetical protein